MHGARTPPAGLLCAALSIGNTAAPGWVAWKQGETLLSTCLLLQLDAVHAHLKVLPLIHAQLSVAPPRHAQLSASPPLCSSSHHCCAGWSWGMVFFHACWLTALLHALCSCCLASAQSCRITLLTCTPERFPLIQPRHACCGLRPRHQHHPVRHRLTGLKAAALWRVACPVIELTLLQDGSTARQQALLPLCMLC